MGGDPSSSSRMSPSRSPADSTVATADDDDDDDAAATSALPSISSCPASPIQVALRSRMGVGIVNLEVVLSVTEASSLLAVVDFDTVDVHSGG